MSVKDERRTATTEMRMVRWAMGMSLLEHRRNEEILEEVKVEHIATVMRRRRLEWFGHVKRRDETENSRAVVEMKMDGKRPRGRPKLRWKDTSGMHVLAISPIDQTIRNETYDSAAHSHADGNTRTLAGKHARVCVHN